MPAASNQQRPPRRPAPPASEDSRPVPQDVDAEKSLLGSLLIDPDAFLRVAPIVKARDFMREQHTWVFQACEELQREGRRIDQITVARKLDQQGRLQSAGDVAFITELVAFAPTSVHAEDYAQIVRECAANREIINLAGEIAGWAYTGGKPEQVMEKARQRLLQIVPPTAPIGDDDECSESGLRCELKPAGLGYVLNFPDARIQITVDHLRRSSEGLSGELLVEGRLPLLPRRLHWGRLNMSSTSARSTLAKYLAKRTDGAGLAWDNIVEDVCRRIAVAERTGEPFIMVGKLPPSPADTWLVRNFLPRGQTTTVFGEGGSGKSRVALAIALSVQTGLEFISGYTPLEQGPILYLDWETSKGAIDERIKQLCQGMGIEPVEVAYRFCTVPLAEQVEEVLRFCQEQGTALIIIDSMEMAMSGTREPGSDPNDAVLRLHSALRLLGRTAIIVDHINRASLNDNKGARNPYGGIFKTNLVRMAYELRKAKDSGDGALHIALFNTKRNDNGLPFKPVGLKVAFAEGWTTYAREGIDDDDLIAGLTVGQKMVNAIEKFGPQSVSELVDICGSKEMTIRSELSRGKKRFVKLPNGKYGLLSFREEAGDELPF